MSAEKGDKVVIALSEECLADVDATCEPGTRQLVGMAVQTAGTLVYVAMYLYYQAMAFRDHRQVGLIRLCCFPVAQKVHGGLDLG